MLLKQYGLLATPKRQSTLKVIHKGTGDKMPKVGLNLSVDVTKLDKSKFYEGKNGAKYANLTVFVDSSPDQYGQNGGIIEQQTKEEQDAGNSKNYVGNAKIFWTMDADNFRQQSKQQAPAHHQPPTDDFEDDIPF